MQSGIIKKTGLLIIIAVAAAFLSCGGNDNPVDTTTQQAPVLPEMSTMTMDLSFFGLAPLNQASIKKGVPNQALLASATGKDNWINAAVRVFYVQLVFYAAFEPPIAAFALAINSVPQKQPDGSWLWTYIYVENGIEYGIFLYGKLVGDHVEWRMEVSTNNPEMMLDHFIWFDGEAMNDDSSGFWQFYTPVDVVPITRASSRSEAGTPGVPSVRIDWLNTANNEHQLTVLVNEVGSADEGDNFVFYESPVASYIEYTDVSMPEVHNITWYPDGSGSIQVPDYNNGQKACWDTSQNDIACTP